MTSHLYYAATCPLSFSIGCSRGAAARLEYQRVRRNVEAGPLERVGLAAHPLWPEIQPFIHIELYPRDGGHAHPRFRIEIRGTPPPAMAARWLAAMMPCVACGRLMHPIRERTLPGADHRNNQQARLW